MYRFISALICLTFIFSAQPSFAQEGEVAGSEEEIVLTRIVTGGQNQESPLQCFDYYTFNSVEVSLQPTVSNTIPGALMNFTGTVVNTNPYPLTDVSLVAKVFRVNESLVQEGNGNELVDYFTITENKRLGAEEAQQLEVDWEVPNNVGAGEYFLTVYVLDGAFALTGLAFSDDVYANNSRFTVESDESERIALNKNATLLNGDVYRFVDFPPIVSASNSPATITTQLVNPTDEERTVPLQWRQYSFDASTEENLRNVETEIHTLAPGETKEVSYTAKEDRASVIFVTAKTDDRGLNSILHLRYVQEGRVQPRLSFLTLTAPLSSQNNEITVLACAHTTGETLTDNVLSIELLDADTGELVHRYQYDGEISGQVGGYGETFTLDTTHNNVLLRATLEHDGVVVESAEVAYNCTETDAVSCLENSKGNPSLFDRLLENKLWFYAGVLILLGLLFLVFSVHRRHHKKLDINVMKQTPPSTLAALLLALFVAPLVFFSGAHAAEAKSVSATGSHSDSMSASYIAIDFRADYTVLYSGNLINESTGTIINDGATIQAGTIVRLEPKVRANNGVITSDVHYNFTGQVWGTPNGAWNSFNYASRDLIGGGQGQGCLPGIMGEHNYAIYARFRVDKIAETFSLSGVTYDDLGSGRYRVTGNGAATARITYPATIGTWNVIGEARSGQNVCGPSFGNTSTNISARNINFTFNVTGANNPPAQPVITGPTSGVSNTLYNFTISGGADPDGDRVRYGLADASCTTVFQWLPGGTTTFIPGSQNLPRSWASDGSYNLYVLSEDENSARSSCDSHAITINTPPPASVDLKINGSDGPLNVNKTAPMNLTWTHSNAGTCTIYGDGLPGGQLSNVAGTGSHTIPGSTVGAGSEVYAMSCTSGSDSVSVTIQNQNPNPPTITQTAGNNQSGSAQTFSFTGTDPDGDQIFYEIDWDNNGTVEAATPASGFVNSGAARTANRTWPSQGTYTIQVRTVDSDNARSAWAQHTVTINLAIPATPSNITLSCPAPGTSITANWSSVSGATSYNVRIDNQTASSWNGSCNPATGAGDYCQDGVTGTSLTISSTPEQSYNAWVHACNSAGCSGSRVVASPLTCIGYPNLAFESYQATPGTYNTATGVYDTMTVRFVPRNTTTRAIGATTHRVSYAGNNYDGTTPGIAGNAEGAIQQVVLTNVPYGPFTASIILNQGNVLPETTFADNTVTISQTIPPPNPDLFITADRIQVRANENVVITWGANNPYPMDCRVLGPGVDVTSANAIPAGTANPSITAKSEYVITCTHPDAASPYSTSVIVETVGSFEEV